MNALQLFLPEDYALVEYTLYRMHEVFRVVCPTKWQYDVLMHRLNADASVATITEKFN